MLLASCISAVAQEYAGREKLRAQSNEFRKEVIRVAEGVYVAVGYSASNVILIQGELQFGRVTPPTRESYLPPTRGARQNHLDRLILSKSGAKRAAAAFEFRRL